MQKLAFGSLVERVAKLVKNFQELQFAAVINIGMVVLLFSTTANDFVK